MTFIKQEDSLEVRKRIREKKRREKYGLDVKSSSSSYDSVKEK